MLPQPQTVPLIFEGLDTFTDPKRGISTKLDLLENCYVSVPLKLQKRNGFTSQSRNIDGGGAVSAGGKLARYRDELVMCDGLALYTRNSITSTLAKRGKLPTGQVAIDRLTGDTLSTARLNVTGCYAGGVLLVAWQVSQVSGVSWRLYDVATGGVLNSADITGAQNPKAIACGGFLFLYTLEGSQIKVRRVNPASPATMGGTTTVHTAAPGCYDVTTDTANSQMLVSYFDAAVTTNIFVRSVTTAPVASAAVGFNTASAGLGIQVMWLQHTWNNSTAYLAVAWSNSGAGAGLRLHDIDTGTLAMSNATQVDTRAASAFGTITGYFSSATRVIFMEVLGATVDLNVITGWAQGTTFELMRSCCLATKIFVQGGRYYFGISYEDTTQRHRLLVEYEHGTQGANGGTAIVGYLAAKDDGGKAGLAIGGVGYANISDPIEPINYGNGAWGLPGHYSFDFGAHYGVVNHRITFSESGLGTPVNFADVLFTPGLQLNAYDGAENVEAGFYQKPKVPALAAGGAATGSLSSGVYQVKLVFRWTDARGRIWRSEASPSASLTPGAGNSIVVTASTERLTNKDPKFNIATGIPKVVIEAYRTAAAQPTYYLDNTGTNSVTADTITINLTQSDAALANQELLYSQGGVIANETPPAVRLVRAFGGRLFVCVGDGDVWHTKDLAEGEGAAFSTRFRIPLDTSSGRITALFDVDTSFMMGQRNAVYILGGGDPTDTGANLFSQPQRVNTDVGPLDQVSVARMRLGVAFNTSKGIHLMSRGLDSQFIGSAVQRYTQADTITGAMVADGTNQARWTTSNGDLLVYDFVLSQWFVWTGLAAVACALYQNQMAILASDGTIKLETAGVFSDDSTAVVMKIRTGWLALAGFAGYQRLWGITVVGEYKGAHTLQASFSYNYSTFVNETMSTNAGAATYNNGIEAGYTWEARQKQQLCAAVQITIQDSLVGAGSEGFQLSGIALEIGAIGGKMRLPANRAMA